MEKTTIITDLGGVVLEKGFSKLWDYIAKHHGLSFEDVDAVFKKQYAPFFSGQMSVSEFWKGFETELGLSEGESFWQNKLFEFFVPQKGVLELYDSLRSEGHTIGLLSDEVSDIWKELDRRHSLSPHFDFIVISSEVGMHKPDPEIYKLALTKSPTTPSRNVFIDDREENLAPAKELGMQAILFQDTNTLEKKLRSSLEEGKI